MQTQNTYPDTTELKHLLMVLKNNRDNIELSVLKTKYKNGYDNLCCKINTSASDYAKEVSLHGLQVHKDYAEDIKLIVNEAIESSGILHDFSRAIYVDQDLDRFVKLTEDLRYIILTALSDYLEAKIVIDNSKRNAA